MTSKAEISVVIANYNYERYVGKAIASVLDQNYAGCEVIVVDDGSSDDSWETISDFQGIKAIRIENAGQLAACRVGLKEARAPFILFLDADDELKPGSLATIASRLKPDVSKLQFGLTRIDENGHFVARSSPLLTNFSDNAKIVQEILRRGSYTTPPTSGNVFRRDVAELIEEVDYERVVDGVILFAAPFMGRVVSMSAELGCYRVHGANHSGGGKPPTLAAVEAELQRYADRMRHLREIVSRHRSALDLISPESSFFYLERNFYRLVILNIQPRLLDVCRLLSALLKYNLPARNKVGLAAGFALMAVLPSSRARAVLTHRFRPTRRSISGLLRAILCGESV